ncbi:MAG: hypothetical protein NT167_24370, partial [Verrucomicrobia bacterium]|nr:hypothetical protein [Verrucomicrobiota bacterium]
LNRLLLEDACELPGALRRGLPRTLDNFWESWLRNIDDNRSMARDFNARQHRVQLFFVVLLPWVASVAALSCASCSKALQDWPWWGFLLAYLFYGVSWGWLYKQVRSVTDLEYARKSAVAGGNLLLMLRRVCKDWFVAAALTVSLGVIPGCLAWAKSPIAGNQPAEYVLSYSTNAQSSGMVLHLANVILMPYTNQSGANASAPSPTNQTVEWRLEIGTNGNGAGAVLRLPHFEMIRTN